MVTLQPQAAIAAEPQMWQPHLLPRVVTMRRLFAAQPQATKILLLASCGPAANFVFDWVSCGMSQICRTVDTDQ